METWTTNQQDWMADAEFYNLFGKSVSLMLLILQILLHFLAGLLLLIQQTDINCLAYRAFLTIVCFILLISLVLLIKLIALIFLMFYLICLTYITFLIRKFLSFI